MKRDILKKLKSWKSGKDRKPLILKGARQVGKTHTLKFFAKECFPAFHYINFEKEEELWKIFEKNLDPKRILHEFGLFLDKNIDIKNDLLILDEIQNCPLALTSLKYFEEELPGLAICAAGSLLGIHLNPASFPVGKVEYLGMFPMSFEEFLLGAGEARLFDFLRELKVGSPIPEIVHSLLWDQLKIYFIVGGLPEVVKTYVNNKDDLVVAFTAVRKKQVDLITTYNADMAKHSGKQNSMHIERLWRNISSQLAREQNGSAQKFKFKSVIPGITGYSRLAGVIDWLQATGLIIRTPITNSGRLPFSAYTQENFFKLYLFDVGILGALSGLPPKTLLDYDYGTYKGYFAENFAAQEFLCSGVREIYCWREGKSEVEFLREVDGRLYPIEIKSGWVTQAKSLKVFAGKYNPEYRTIMSAKNLHIDDGNRIHRYPLYLSAHFPISRCP